MNISPTNRTAYLATRMRAWLELLLYGTEEADRVRARRNYQRLIVAYPEVAIAHKLPLDVPED